MVRIRGPGADTLYRQRSPDFQAPVFGIRGASWFLGVSEWVFGLLHFLGFWGKRLGILGAGGSAVRSS